MFKYMSADAALLFARTLKVRFTQPSDLNDPFEFRPLIDFEATAEEYRSEIDRRISEMFGTVDGVLEMIEKHQASDPNFPKMPIPIDMVRKMMATSPDLGRGLIAEMQKHKFEILKTIKTAAAWETQWEKLQQTLGQSVGIFSLTEDPAHILMWSHYASQHTGIVVEFDENDSWFDQRRSPSDEFRHLVRVTYVQNPQPRTWSKLNGADLLYTKNADWVYEREWRIIRTLNEGTETRIGIFCFDVPPKVVRSIIFGFRTSLDLETEVRKVVSANSSLKDVSFKRTKLGSARIELTDASRPAVPC
jgi:hypothetical protein